jgi:hypothetical protein
MIFLFVKHYKLTHVMTNGSQNCLNSRFLCSETCRLNHSFFHRLSQNEEKRTHAHRPRSDTVQIINSSCTCRCQASWADLIGQPPLAQTLVRRSINTSHPTSSPVRRVAAINCGVLGWLQQRVKEERYAFRLSDVFFSFSNGACHYNPSVEI